MALHISNPKANKLARKLARQKGETLTDAVIRALEERLERNASKEVVDHEGRRAAILEIVEAFNKLPIQDDRTADEILGYDENGLPA